MPPRQLLLAQQIIFDGNEFGTSCSPHSMLSLLLLNTDEWPRKAWRKVDDALRIRFLAAGRIGWFPTRPELRQKGGQKDQVGQQGG